jgi:tight adherence protein B
MILFAGLLLTAIAYLWMNKLGEIPEQARIFAGKV